MTQTSVKSALTENRPGANRQPVENEAYMEMLLRLLRSLGKRIAEGDTEDLVRVATIQQALDDATSVGIAGLRKQGYSWAEIGRPLDISRQAAQQRWGS